MAFQSIPAADIAVDKFVTEDLMAIIKDNFDYLYGHSLSAVGVINGSFEIDSDADGLPDSWDVELYAGGSCVLNTTVPAHGAQCLEFIHPGGAGNGGGYADSDYIEVGNPLPVKLSGWYWATVAGMKCEIIIAWYTAAKASISSTTLYSSTVNPTSKQYGSWWAIPPSTAKYAKVKVIGGKNDTDVAGSAYFDGFGLSSYGQWVSPADTYVIGSADGGGTSSASYTKVAELQCTVSGHLRISFLLSAVLIGSSEQATGRIYRNGVAVGTERTVSANTFAVFSEDIDGWSEGDKLQIYVHSEGNYAATAGQIEVFADSIAIQFYDTL